LGRGKGENQCVEVDSGADGQEKRILKRLSVVPPRRALRHSPVEYFSAMLYSFRMSSRLLSLGQSKVEQPVCARSNLVKGEERSDAAIQAALLSSLRGA
jgi:hypothetical protein